MLYKLKFEIYFLVMETRESEKLFLLVWPRQESNLYRSFRKRQFYPLNYEAINIGTQI